MERAYKTTELPADARAAVERLIGRSLEQDEAVQVIVHRRQGQLTQTQAALRRIREMARGKSLQGTTIRELIEEGRR